jgi:hypothetical protein
MFSGGIFAGRFRDGEVGRECGCSTVNPFDVVWYVCVLECECEVIPFRMGMLGRARVSA